jgi:hypothetical protein
MHEMRRVVMQLGPGHPYVVVRKARYCGQGLLTCVGRRIWVRTTQDDSSTLDVIGPSGEIVERLFHLGRCSCVERTMP